jgi:Domain of unknown function (DUF1931)
LGWYLSDNICVIDFGLKATSDGDLLPPGCTQGDFVTGEIYLNLPLCTEVVPDEVLKALAYKRKVNRILADMTPYVPCPDNPRFLVRGDLPITKGLQHCIHDFEALDLDIALSRILEHAVPGPQIDLLYSEETEARLPAIARGLSPAFARTFKIIDRQIKHLATEQTEQWDRAFRIFDLQ